MLNFVKKMTYLTVQQGKIQDTKVNTKRVFLWLGDRMCSKAVNSQLKRHSALCYSAQPWGRLGLLPLALFLVSVEPLVQWFSL